MRAQAAARAAGFVPSLLPLLRTMLGRGLGVGEWFRGKQRRDLWLSRRGWGCVSTRGDPFPLLSSVYPPLRPGRKAKIRDPWLGPRALTSPFLSFFLQLLLKMIGLMTC